MTDLPDPASLPTERLEHEVTTLAGHIAAATCRWLLLVAELDRREAWATWGCRSMAHWLSMRCGISLSTAREQVRVAHALHAAEAHLGQHVIGNVSRLGGRGHRKDRRNRRHHHQGPDHVRLPQC